VEETAPAAEPEWSSATLTAEAPIDGLAPDGDDEMDDEMDDGGDDPLLD
jgi:hypothetical protein